MYGFGKLISGRVKKGVINYLKIGSWLLKQVKPWPRPNKAGFLFFNANRSFYHETQGILR